MLLQASCSTALPLYVYTATIVPFSAFILMVDHTVSDFFGLDSEELLYLCIISCWHSDHSCTMISLLSSSLCIIRFLTIHIALELFLLHCQSNRRLIFKKWINGFHSRKETVGDVLEGDVLEGEGWRVSERNGNERGKIPAPAHHSQRQWHRDVMDYRRVNVKTEGKNKNQFLSPSVWLWHWVMSNQYIKSTSLHMLWIDM